MSESELIWKYIQLEFPDEHPAIYLYCCTLDNDEDVIKKIMDNLTKVFSPSYEHHYLLKITKAFLENKKKLYMKGLIKVKSAYK